MSDLSAAFYSEMQDVVNEIMPEFEQGLVTLVATERAASDPETPWTPGVETTETYRLSAAVRTVDRKYVDGTLIVGNEVQATTAVRAVHTHTNGAPIAETAADIEPKLSDRLVVDGRSRQIKKIVRVPAAGTAVAFTIIAEA